MDFVKLFNFTLNEFMRHVLLVQICQFMIERNRMASFTHVLGCIHIFKKKKKIPSKL